MNRNNSSLLRKTIFLLGALTIGWAAEAQTGTNPANPSIPTTPSDTTQRQGMHHRRGGHNGGDFAGHGLTHYTHEQRQQVAAINTEYHQRSAALYKKDDITLKEYKASCLALQKEKKEKIESLLTPQQTEEMAARRKRIT